MREWMDGWVDGWMDGWMDVAAEAEVYIVFVVTVLVSGVLKKKTRTGNYRH